MSFFKNASILFLLHSLPYIYKGKDNNKSVNIFHKDNYRITLSVSAHYKSHCFALQKRRFCTVKAALLHRKTYAFATSNRNYHFSSELSLQYIRYIASFIKQQNGLMHCLFYGFKYFICTFAIYKNKL